jgi:hypothetical protein
MCSMRSGEVEAGYLWVGAKRARSYSTVPHAKYKLIADLDSAGRFVGLEMLRTVTDTEAREFMAWAHRTWGAREGTPHWACSALMTLRDAWQRTGARSRSKRAAARRRTSLPRQERWIPELAAS